MAKENKPGIIRDIWDAILNDKWMWVVVWGPQRCGKTTLQMQIGHYVYYDWDEVLQSFVFNLSGLLYKMDRDEPKRILTLNKLHNRIPYIIYDDWGGSSNKAITQYDRAWDLFKGAFDLLGTEIGVLCASMVDPAEPTFQLQQKYTHEVFIPQRGIYKYDEVEWEQDYKGWKPRKKKTWIETNYFEPVPDEVYKQYDEMRMSLVAEVKQRIQDEMAETHIPYILKRIQPSDINLLETIQQKGMIQRKSLERWLGEQGKEALVRCKARNLVVPVRKKTTYWYDITNLGLDVLETLKNPENPYAKLINKQPKEAEIELP